MKRLQFPKDLFSKPIRHTSSYDSHTYYVRLYKNKVGVAYHYYNNKVYVSVKVNSSSAYMYNGISVGDFNLNSVIEDCEKVLEEINNIYL